MQKISLPKMSMLGLVLLAASAVTAAFTPSKSVKESNNDGSLREFSNADSLDGAVLSCVTDNDSHLSCTASTNGGVTNTTAATGADSKVANKQTVGNTSDTLGAVGDQTSVVQ